MLELTQYEPTVEDDAPPVHGRGCPQCGAPVEPLDRFCNACGSEQVAETVAIGAIEPQRHFRCENCGASVAVGSDQRSYVCAFCDSTYVVEFSPQQSGRQAPEGRIWSRAEAAPSNQSLPWLCDITTSGRRLSSRVERPWIGSVCSAAWQYEQ